MQYTLEHHESLCIPVITIWITEDQEVQPLVDGRTTENGVREADMIRPDDIMTGWIITEVGP